MTGFRAMSSGRPGIIRPNMRRLTVAPGQVFGYLTAIEELPGTHRKILCACACGGTSTPNIENLLGGGSRSCGKRCKYHGTSKKDAAITKMFGSYKRNADTRGFCFEITQDDFTSVVLEPCQYCGAQPRETCYSEQVRVQVAMNGVDRIDSTKGYTKENVVPCCTTCNNAKRTMTVAEFLQWARRVVLHNGGV